jgi:hypothetical protein
VSTETGLSRRVLRIVAIPKDSWALDTVAEQVVEFAAMRIAR